MDYSLLGNNVLKDHSWPLYVPFARDLFRFSTLHAIDLAICSIAGLFSVLWFEALKILSHGRVANSI